MPFDPSTAKPAGRFDPSTAKPDPVLQAIDTAYPRSVIQGAANQAALEESQQNAAPFMGVFSRNRPRTEASGNPGVAAGVATVLMIIKNLVGGDEILDALAQAGSIPQPIRDFAKVARNATKETIDRELANYQANFGDSEWAKLAEAAFGMSAGLAVSAALPNATYTQQIMNGMVSGYPVGGPAGAAVGAAIPLVTGGPETALHILKRRIAGDETPLRSIFNLFNQDAAANAPVNLGPNYAAGQELERRLSAASGQPITLTLGQKTQNPDVLALEQRLMGSGRRLAPSLAQLKAQNEAMQAEARRVVGGFGDDVSEAAAGASVRNAAQERLRQLEESRRQAWNWNMVSDEGPGNNVVNTTYDPYPVPRAYSRGVTSIPDLPEDMYAGYGQYLGSKMPPPVMPSPAIADVRSAARPTLGAAISSEEQGLLLTNYRNALGKVLKENKVKLTTAEMDAVTKEIEKRIAQASTGTGSPQQVQKLLSEATQEAYGGGNPFQDMETAAARRVSGIIKDALESVIEQGKSQGNRFAGRLDAARKAYANESRNIELFENSVLGKELKNAKTDEDVVRMLIKNKSPSQIEMARRYIEDVNPGAWANIQRKYGEMMLGAGERAALDQYSSFGAREFKTRQPVRGDLNAPAERGLASEEAILGPSAANPTNRFSQFQGLYEDAGRVGQLQEPMVNAGANDMTKMSQMLGAAAGGATNPVGATPFIARYLTDPIMGRLFYNWLFTPAGQQSLLNLGLNQSGGALGAVGAGVFPALQGEQQ